MKVVVALGGNALSPSGATGSVEEMRTALDSACDHLAGLVEAGVGLVVTHGNGPQIGRILLQQEAAAPDVPPMPMDVCGAESQGQIGYLIAQSLDNALRRRGRRVPVLCLVTQVVVDGRDPAFRRPTKPVGPAYDAATAERIAQETGYVFTDQGRGRWRRVVASPLPVRIVEEQPLQQVVTAGHVVIASGGGGVPVVEEYDRLRGVEAVVDKDRTAACLAELVGADVLAICTDVPRVQVGFGTPSARGLPRATVAEARAWLDAGEFPEGSMGPKVAAACDFVERTRRRAVITDLAGVTEAVRGDAGTQIVR